MKDWNKERRHRGGKHSNERGRESLHQTVLICQSSDARLKDDDRGALGTVTLTVQDLHRILTHGHQFPFFTDTERREGGTDHKKTRSWETCDIEVWDTSRDFGFPVTKDRDMVTHNTD
jgi:hypothetical protein